jgi:hypothetical protein
MLSKLYLKGVACEYYFSGAFTAGFKSMFTSGKTNFTHSILR